MTREEKIAELRRRDKIRQLRERDAQRQSVPPIVKEPSLVDSAIQTAKDAGLGAVSGLSAGLSDEAMGLVGGAGAALQGTDVVEGYRKGRDEQRLLEKQAQERSPIAFGGANLAGAVTTGLATGASIPAMIGMGALTGLGTSEADLTKGDVAGAAIDTGIGGALGAAIPVAGAAVKKGVELGTRGLAGLTGIPQESIKIAIKEGVTNVKNSIRPVYDELVNMTKGLKERMSKYQSIRAEKIPIERRAELTNQIKKLGADLYENGMAINQEKANLIKAADESGKTVDITGIRSAVNDMVEKNVPENIRKMLMDANNKDIMSTQAVKAYLKEGSLGKNTAITRLWLELPQEDVLGIEAADQLRSSLYPLLKKEGMVTKESKPITQAYNDLRRQMSDWDGGEILDELFEKSRANLEQQRDLMNAFGKGKEFGKYAEKGQEWFTKVNPEEFNPILNLNKSTRLEQLSRAAPEIGAEVSGYANKYQQALKGIEQEKILKAQLPELGFTEKSAQAFISKANRPQESMYKADKLKELAPELQQRIKTAAAGMDIQDAKLFGNFLRIGRSSGIPIGDLITMPLRIAQALEKNPKLMSAYRSGGVKGAVAAYNVLSQKGEISPED